MNAKGNFKGLNQHIDGAIEQLLISSNNVMVSSGSLVKRVLRKHNWKLWLCDELEDLGQVRLVVMGGWGGENQVSLL